MKTRPLAGRNPHRPARPPATHHEQGREPPKRRAVRRPGRTTAATHQRRTAVQRHQAHGTKCRALAAPRTNDVTTGKSCQRTPLGSSHGSADRSHHEYADTPRGNARRDLPWPVPILDQAMMGALIFTAVATIYLGIGWMIAHSRMEDLDDDNDTMPFHIGFVTAISLPVILMNTMRSITGLIIGKRSEPPLPWPHIFSCAGAAQHTHEPRADAQDFSLVD